MSVSIQNLEEPGTVTLSSVQPQENIQLTATLEDDDGPTRTTWQWYRTSSRGSTGTELTGETSASYTPVGDDVGFYLRATAAYDDGFDNGNTATAASANRVVAVNPDNVRPEFDPNGDYVRAIRENLTPRNLGAPVRATDPNSGDRLTYSIPASDYFEIVDSTGQLRTKAVLDHEDDDEHTVTVTATDPGNLRTTVDVTITVEDVDETPVISGPATIDFEEGDTGTVATYTATDPDDTGIDWVLTGSDDDAFTLSGGVLTFNATPDYEEKNSYRITIEAHERSPGASVARLSVTVRVTNVDEPGMVEIDVDQPRVGQQLTPMVEDPDGGVGSVEWKWESSPDGTNWSPIPGATSRNYTPTRDDNGKQLRVIAIYRDREGPGKTETHEFTDPVVLRPYFPSDTDVRTAEENTPADRNNVGSRFTARHPDNVTLTYRLTGGDTSYFDHRRKPLARWRPAPSRWTTKRWPATQAVVEITASDSQTPPGTATITVTVSVTDECRTAGEPPCAPGRPGVASASDTSLQGDLVDARDALLANPSPATSCNTGSPAPSVGPRGSQQEQTVHTPSRA